MADTPEKTVTVTAELPQSMLDALVELAKKRGVNANTVIQQAILNETFLDEKESQGGTVLVEDAKKTLRKVKLSR
jgi:hypothetical protein